MDKSGLRHKYLPGVCANSATNSSLAHFERDEQKIKDFFRASHIKAHCQV